MQHGYMATVKKISRSVNYLPPMKGLTDWFNYAFKSSELDEVHRFPSISPSNEKEREISKVQQKTEEIFKLPCLRMDLKTKHVQVKDLLSDICYHQTCLNSSKQRNCFFVGRKEAPERRSQACG